MAVVKNLMVRAGADFSAITKQASKASQSMRGMQNSVSRSCNAMTKAANGLKKAFGAIAAVVSVTAIVNAAKDAAAAYDETAESQVKLAQVMRNTMNASNSEIQSILDLADAQQKVGIVSADAQIAGAQELATYLSTSSALKELIPVMNDMAAQQYGFNVTAEETTSIATMLGKVMSGQTSGLSRYGYYFTEAQEAILKYGTEAQRAAVLARVVQSSVGGMNQALAATPTGRMKQLSNTLADIKASFGMAVRTIGTVFLPLLNKVASVLAAVATLANKVAQTIANVFGGQAAGNEWKFLPSGSASAASDTADAVDDLSGSYNNLSDAANSAKKAQEDLQQTGFDTLNILKGSDSGEDDYDYSYTVPDYTAADNMIQEIDTGSDEASESVGWLEKALTKVKGIWEDFKSGLDFTKLKAGWDELRDAVSGFANAVGDVFNSIWERVLKPFGQWTINEALPASLRVLSGVFEVLAAVIDKLLRPAFEWLWDNFLSKVASWTGEIFIKALNEIATQLQNIAKVINGEMRLSDFLAQLNPLEKILLGVATAVAAVKTALMLVKAVEFAKGIGEWITGLGKFTGVVAEVVKSAGGLKAAMVECWGGVNTAIAGVGTVLGGLTMAISGFVSQWQHGASLASAAVMGIGLAIAAVGAVLLGAPAAVAAIVAAVVFAVAEGVVLIRGHWDEIKQTVQDKLEEIRLKLNEWLDNAKKTVQDKLEEIRLKLKEWIEKIFQKIEEWLKKIKDKIKEFWDWITGKSKKSSGDVSDDVNANMSDMVANATVQHGTLRERIASAWDSIKQSVHDKVSSVVNRAREKFSEMHQNLSNTMSNIHSFISDKWSSIKSSVSSHTSSMVSDVQSKFTNIKNQVSQKVNDIKSSMNFSWSIPKPKLPQISVGWSELGFGGLKVPNFSVSWGAMGGILDAATLIGAGEAGREALLPLDRNTQWVGLIVDEMEKRGANFGNGGRADAADDTEGEIINAIMSAAVQIVTAIRESGDSGDADFDKFVRQVTKTQRRQARAAGAY